MGGDEKAHEAAPAHRVRVGDLRVSWRPVTVADFGPFVSTGAYAEGDAPWWRDGAGRVARGELDGREPVGWADQLFHPNRPVTGVSWYAARAFCRWATVHLGEAWGVPAGHAVDLPTEAEWEYLARGREGRTYPWPGTADPVQGDAAPASFGGYRGEGPGHPTPVGAYPLGHRRWGDDDLVDLAGNVWEWCRDTWREAKDASWPAIRGGGRIDTIVDNPCHLGDSGSPRVVRGGSWSGDPWSLRCACRHRGDPRIRYGYLGFRVLVRVPPEHEA
ncbi:formylglycine-generating enzyme family protein [Myxococcota bacterium]|nr:formylglycine-generating enzyme family protein [Myxococcota bacterium]